MPPPIREGVDSAPARARPVPFWRNALAPVMSTSPRVSVECVPRRRAFSSARTVSWTRDMWKGWPKTASSRSALPVFWPRMAALGLAMAHVAPDLDGRAARPGYRAADEQQILVGDHVDDLESALGDALAAHLTGAADALEHARGRGRGADRARRAHVVRAVGHGTAREVVALDGALEALALRDAGDLHGLALLEDVDLHGLADLQLAGLVAELHEVAQRRGVCLLEMAEL